MIAVWLAAAALARDPMAGSIVVSADVVAQQDSSRHDVVGALRLAATYAPRPWGVRVEFGGGPFADRTDVFAFSGWRMAGAAVFEGVLAPHATAFHAGIGPAVAVRLVKFAADGVGASTTRVEGGARLRMGLDGPLGPTLAWSWHMGAVIRPSGSDWDTGLGLGVAL